MSDVAWGQCGAYGCPLVGSFGRGDMWCCFCHYDASSGAFQEITRAIKEVEFIARSTVEIRACFGTEQWPSVYRGIQRRLITAGRRDLLLCEADSSPHRPGKPVVKRWLNRLETEILQSVQSLKAARRAPPPTVQTAPVDGPSHVTEFIEPSTGEIHGA